MIDIIKKEIIEESDYYIILYNGEKIEASDNIQNLNFNQNIDIKVIHIIDRDIDISININENINVKMAEILYEVKNNPKINFTINVGKSSQFDYLSFKKTTKDSNISAFVNTQLAQNSYINNKNLLVFSHGANESDNIFLNSMNASADVKSVIINNSGCTQDFSTNIHHIGQSTISTMSNYGICKYNSVLNINSNGIIRKGASKTELRQKTKGLLLDMKSSISANPWLQIEEHDCLASHGASIGAIDEEELYYLMSRGLTRSDAEKMIISGFIYPFLNEIKEGKLQDFLISWMNLNI